MAGSEYQEASTQFKEEIITQYLRNNPGVKRSEVTMKIVNGRNICTHISATFDNLSKRKIRSKEEQEVLKDLSSGSDKRYTACLESISSTRQYAGWLVESPGIAYNENDQQHDTHFLNRREQLSESYAMELSGFKKKIAKLMESEEETPEEQVKLLMMEYFQSSHSQLKCQKSIMEKECSLGGMFSEYSEEFIKEHYLNLKPKAGMRTIEAVKKAYNILRSSGVDMEEVDANEKITSKDQLKKLAGGLKSLNHQLERKREQLNAIQKMVAFLEDMVDIIKEEIAPSKPKKAKKKPIVQEEEPKRMAFLDRAKRLFIKSS